MDMIHVNVWAALVAGLVNMFVGAVWYMPAVFGKIWMRELGYKDTDVMSQSGMGKSYAITLLGALVMGYITAVMVNFANAGTFAEGAIVGLLLWLGFAITIPLNDVVFGKKTWTLYVVNAAYYLVILVINGAMLAMWK